MLDYQLYGLNPKGHHLTNVLFHIVNAILLFLVLRRMTGALWQSALVAALFALHPLNVESVAWAAERKNVLSSFFWLATMWAYIGYVEKKSVRRYGLVFLFLALGLMSKPMLVTLPFVLLMMDYWPLGRLKPGEKGENISRLIMEKVPLLALAVGSSVVTYLIQKYSGAVRSVEAVPLPARILNALVSYLEYLEKMAWPKSLAVLYPHPGSALPIWKGVVCGGAIIIISVAGVWMVRRAPYLAFGWFWYLGTLVPVIGLVQVGAQAMADRYAYVPLIGIFIVIAWGLPELVAKWRYREKVLAVSAAILLPALMAITWIQVSHWKNSITLFKHAIEAVENENPNFSYIHYNLGVALYDLNKVEEAMVHYREAIRLDPRYAEAHNNLAAALDDQRKFDEAIFHYKKAIRFKPNYPEAYYNLGNTLKNKREVKEAIDRYREAIRLKPDYAEAHNLLGHTLGQTGNTEEALAHFEMAVKIDPAFAEAHYNMGVAQIVAGKPNDATASLRKAIKLQPNYLDAHNNLGIALGSQGNLEEAIFHFETAIKIEPRFAQSHKNLGIALTKMGKTVEAQTHFKAARELKEKTNPGETK